MRWTKFFHGGCGRYFNIRHPLEQDEEDIDHCPVCGGTGEMRKKEVVEIKGLIARKKDTKMDD